LQALRDAGIEAVFPRKRVQLSEEELLPELPGASATLAGVNPLLGGNRGLTPPARRQ
jgi:hypothetical protein